MENNDVNGAIMGAATSIMAAGILVMEDEAFSSQIPRAPRGERDFERELFINRILHSGDTNCVNQIRMRPQVFFELCRVLRSNNFLHETVNVSIKEQLLVFCHILGHNVRLRVIGSRFNRSTETIHRYFRIALQAILKLYKHVIRPPDGTTPSTISKSRRFYPYFKDCIGALDGTHVRASVPPEIQGKFRGRKEKTTQNVLAAVTYDLKFVYVLAGWEGTAHDSRILTNALSRPRGMKIPEGKYYLADAGYGIQPGIISPYRGVRYHRREFSDHSPENEKELFNHCHSSLRSAVERAFGVLKRRFRVLDAEPFWSFDTQVDVVLACCILHNFIMGVDPYDPFMQELNVEVESQSQERRHQQTQREEREENREWAAKRDSIARLMWDDYTRHRMNV